MNQIICPKCGEKFTIDESSYAQIVNQIRNEEFENELKTREKTLEEKAQMQIRLLQEKLESEKGTVISDKDRIIAELMHNNDLLKAQYEAKIKEELSKKEADIRKKEDESNALLNKLNDQIKRLETELKIAGSEKTSALREAEAAKAKELSEALRDSEIRIAQLENIIKTNDEKAKMDILAIENKNNSEKAVLLEQIKTKETEKDLAISKAIAQVKDEKDAEVAKVNKQYELLRIESESKLASKDQELLQKQELIDYYKDLKTKMSTKMIGETLEQHCFNEFNRNRMGMFPKAYFEKDNDARSGSKGDFIFRDYDEDGSEFISIMFEMKNEADTTATKHKNEDFFKELDKDRNQKHCEYAILVSLLESDSELYNEGIVDVSYRYPKMYVVRPQFFIPIITLLRNAAMNSINWKRKYEIERSNNLDVTHFEENMEAFKSAFGKNYELASRKFQDAIDDIDKTIKALEKTRADLVSSDRNLRLANDKAQGLTIKKLTKNAPSVAQKIEDARSNKQEG